jgi:hypothetical protein
MPPRLQPPGDMMKRFRLSTLMLLILIGGLCMALGVQNHRAARREAELQARLALSWPVYVQQLKQKELLNEQSAHLRRLKYFVYSASERRDDEAREQTK